MKNLKIYKKAIMMIMLGTISLTSTSCQNTKKEQVIEKTKKEKIANPTDDVKLKNMNISTYTSTGIKKEEQQKGTYYLTKKTSLKKKPFESSNTIKKIDAYQKVTLLKDFNSWKLIKKENEIGYVQKENIKKIKGKYIEVDISKQNLKFYNKKGKVTLKTKVVTGIPTDQDRATVLGCFKVYNKEENRTLVGRDYQTPVKYWMPFYKAYGMHDAYWRSDFGGQIYKTNGSHGCVNLPKEVAPKVYKKVDIGTPVLIHN